MNFKLFFLIFLCAGNFFCHPVIAQETSLPGEAIIQQMYNRYQNTWYNHLTFKQQTSFYKNSELQRSQIWYEALTVPGKLIIKFDSLNSGAGIIFRQDTQYVFQENNLVQKSRRVHDLLVLGFDVYGQPPALTIKKLKNRGFDLSKTYETKWQGRPVFVVGASGKDDNSNQFWIDKERLYFVRMLRPAEDGSVHDTRFNNYQRTGGGWVSAEVLFYRNNELVVKEVYHNIKAPGNLDDSIFDLKDFKQATW